MTKVLCAPAALLLGLLFGIAACTHHSSSSPAGGGGGGGGGGSNAPAVPRSLRLLQHPSGPPSYALAWEVDTAVAIDHFDIHVDTAAIADGDTAALRFAVDGNLRTGGVTLGVDTGHRFFRLAAVGTDGKKSALSTELEVDTAGRVAFVGRTGTQTTTLDLLTVVPGAGGIQNLSALPTTATLREFTMAPDGRRAVFNADRATAGTPELWSVALDGTGAVQKLSGAIAAGGGVIAGTKISPDGRTVAFAADRDTPGTAELYVVPIDGSAAPQKRSGAMGFGGSLSILGTADIAWSPTGERIAYSADQRFDGAYELFVANADGSGAAVPIAGDLVPTASLIQYAWSPAGRHLAFNSDRRTDSVIELFVVPADGSAAPTVRSGALLPTADVFNVAWSPDGDRLAFRSTRRASNLIEVFVASAFGNEEPIPLDAGLPSFSGITQFAWSPDGTKIAFTCDREVDGQFELYIADRGGVPAATKVSGAMVTAGDVTLFEWSPDGTQIAFLADKNVDQRVEVFVTRPGFIAGPVAVSGTMPTNGDALDFSWSSEGTRVAFRADLVIDQQFDVFVVSRDGVGGPQPLGVLAGSNALTTAWSRLGR